jgi:hypothetical protein
MKDSVTGGLANHMANLIGRPVSDHFESAAPYKVSHKTDTLSVAAAQVLDALDEPERICAPMR